MKEQTGSSAYLQTVSDEEFLRDEKSVISSNPIGLATQKYLKIKTKSADLIPLELNNTQKSIAQIIIDCLQENKPIRIWILKSRQQGCSTFIESLVYAYSSQRENTNSLIIADEKDHANNLFEMSKLYQEKLELDYPHLAPKLKKSNEKKLEFGEIHSQIIIASAENLEAAKSHTFQICHLSEIAFFRNFKAIMKDLNQTVPLLPNTIVIGETTANGMNDFYEEWTRAVEGKTDWLPVFVPWFISEEYTMPLQDEELYPIEGIHFDADMSVTLFLRDEQRMKEEHGLTDEQLNWRRYMIVNSCNGSITEFNSEYPETWQVAFQVSGKTFFNTQSLGRQQKHRPKRVGEVFQEDGRYIFRDLPDGRVKLYEEPNELEQYIITIDASEALGQDEGTLLVLNNRLNRVVAVMNGQYEPELLAETGAKLGYYYHNALIAPENKGYGYMVCQRLSSLYGNIYKRKRTKAGRLEETSELGFNTNSATRPEMLARSAEVILHNSCSLVDPDVISQHFTFIINPTTKKAEAAPNKQDGAVICFAIAQQVRHEHPYRAPRDTKIKEITHLRRLESIPAVGSRF